MVWEKVPSDCYRRTAHLESIHRQAPRDRPWRLCYLFALAKLPLVLLMTLAGDVSGRLKRVVNNHTSFAPSRLRVNHRRVTATPSSIDLAEMQSRRNPAACI